MSLNCFRSAGYRWTSFRGFCGNLRRFFRSFKYAHQRITRGFCDEDTWDLSSWHSRLLSDSLSQFAENLHSHPHALTSETWKEQLQNAANAFNTLAEIVDNDEASLEEKQAALAVFNWMRDNYFDLWD